MDAALEMFVEDPKDYYGSHINGRLSFAEQRLCRVQEALELLQLDGQPDHELWVVGYEDVVSQHWAPFEDAAPLLEQLTEFSIGYGAVTNHVTEYQAYKLEQAGIPFDVVIGTDITGKPKPDASMFLEGAKRLNANPAHTMMVGDDIINDGLGARDAGLISVLLDRHNTLADLDRVHKVGSLSEVLHIRDLHFDIKRN